MNKTAQYTINGALLGAIINGSINAIKQSNNQQGQVSFNWQECFKEVRKGALIGGASGFLLGLFKDSQMKNVLIEAGGGNRNYV